MANWKEFLEEEFLERGDDFNKMITTLTDEELTKDFDCGYGGSEGVPFTAWGENYVYFPVVYDGLEWVGSAPRNPNNEITSHIGSE